MISIFITDSLTHSLTQYVTMWILEMHTHLKNECKEEYGLYGLKKNQRAVFNTYGLIKKKQRFDVDMKRVVSVLYLHKRDSMCDLMASHNSQM